MSRRVNSSSGSEVGGVGVEAVMVVVRAVVRLWREKGICWGGGG